MNGQVFCMWSTEQLRPAIWAGFTDAAAGNLAFHVGDDPAAVTGRRAGVDAEISRHAGDGVRLAYMEQVHGNAVAELTDGGFTVDGVPTAGPHPVADAMVAMGEAGTSAGLAVMVADCVPVVLAGETASGEPVLAVAHAGRPGVEKGVIAAVVARMQAAGAGTISAVLGPSVCGRCYEVPEAMRAAVAARVPESFATTSWGTPALDLPAAVLAQLRAAGDTAVPSGVCTLEDPRFFSHRRSMRDAEAEGRFIGFVAASRTSTNPRKAPTP